MPKTGFVIHNGIKQVFTTGPQTGNPVVNGYSINGVLQGPTVDYNQPFIEDSIETIYANGVNWRRKYEDQTICAAECNAPFFKSVVAVCDNPNQRIFNLLNLGVNSTITPNTRVESSLNDNFTPLLDATTFSNVTTNGYYTLDLTDTGVLRGTTIYFRLVNLCSNNSTSLPSDIKSAVCDTPTKIPTTLELLYVDYPDQLNQGEGYLSVYEVVGTPGTVITFQVTRKTQTGKGGNARYTFSDLADSTLNNVDFGANNVGSIKTFTIPSSGAFHFTTQATARAGAAPIYDYDTGIYYSESSIEIELEVKDMIESDEPLLPQGTITIAAELVEQW